ncbi:MAG: SUMF1/EgtB/PvdO family nonheme iron enzyme [Rhodospirillales bacterium]
MFSPLGRKNDTVIASDKTHDHCVFISFSSKDLLAAEKVWRELQLFHIPCWISSRHIQPGDDFQLSIVSAMERAKICVLIFSAHADQSVEVKKELTVANHMGLAIIPVRIEETQASGAMRYQLANRQCVDLFVDWDDGMARLVAAIRAYLRSSPASPLLMEEADTVFVPHFSEADLSQTADRLALYLGPIAAILVKQAAAQAASLADLHRLLAEQIANDRERLSFLQPQPSSSVPRPRRWRRYRRLIGLGTAAAAAAGVAVAVAWQVLHWDKPQVARREVVPVREVVPASPPDYPAQPAVSVAPPSGTQAGSEAGAPPTEPEKGVAPTLLVPEAPRAAASVPPTPIRDCDQCPQMRLVPAGEFLMGAPEGDTLAEADERPQRRVVVAKPFYLGAYEVTFGEWDACVADGGCRGFSPATAGWGRERRPVINVNWFDAQAYAGWLSGKSGHAYRLPTEEEWEFAVRGGSTDRYIWGAAVEKGAANCNGCASQWDNLRTAPVGSFKANAFGLYDMLGNVWEWTADCWQVEATITPAKATRAGSSGRCPARVLRGGSWANSPALLRSSARIWGSPDGRTNNVGFRVARDADDKGKERAGPVLLQQVHDQR